MSETLEEKMQRLSELHYLNNNSPFARLSVEEFETWKGERGLNDDDLQTFRTRRQELNRIGESYLEAYKANIVAFLGKKGLLESMRRLCGSSDRALFGRIVLEALNHISKKKRGPSSKHDWLGKQIRFYLNMLKKENPGRPYFCFPETVFLNGKKVAYPGSTYDERIALVRSRYHKLGLGDLLPTDGAVREIIRKSKKRPGKQNETK